MKYDLLKVEKIVIKVEIIVSISYIFHKKLRKFDLLKIYIMKIMGNISFFFPFKKTSYGQSLTCKSMLFFFFNKFVCVFNL